MKGAVHVFVLALVALLLATVNSGNTQMKRRMTSAEILKALKPGQWVQLEGIVQRDLSVLCTEVKLLTGDFTADDWNVTGVVRRVYKVKQQMEILRLPVKIQKGTEFENDAGTFKSFADLKVGLLVEVEGTYLKDGTFLAQEVDDESSKLALEPGLKQEIEATGKVGKVNSAKGTVTLMGITFRLTDRTKGKSAVK